MNCFLAPAPQVRSAANLNGETLVPKESRLKTLCDGGLNARKSWSYGRGTDDG